ncbi:alpha/beta hydrolase [Burkholderia stagnalis]|nr:alpha/beta hydrolase [Burkholderia stagnalis]
MRIRVSIRPLAAVARHLISAAMLSNSYETQTCWLRYQPHFPLHARIDAATAPREAWHEWRGAAIHVDRFDAPDAALTVMLVHGAGGYGRLFAPLGRLLHRAGHNVIAPDLPGYGLTRSPHTLVRYPVWVDLICDLARAEHARTGQRVAFFGGSLGGYLAYLCAARLGPDIAAGVIATTLADPRTPLVRHQFARNRLVRHGMMPLLPLAARLAGGLRLPVKWFTRMGAMANDDALNRIVAADPCGGNVRVPIAFMASIFAVRPDIEPEQFDVCPVLLAHPAADRWTPIESSLPFFTRLRAPKQLVMLDGCGHFPVEMPGIGQLEAAALAFLDEIAKSRPDTR